MNKGMIRKYRRTLWIAAALLLAWTGGAFAAIDGVTGTTFSLIAKTGYISTADGNSIPIWGYANGAGNAQYPGPTLILNQGDVITINLANQLTVPVSIVFPGQDVAATGGAQGLLTREAPAGGTVQYTFTASQPGTYTYYSGTNPDLQVEMGLLGAIIVRPTGYNPADPLTFMAYGDADSLYTREFLFFLTEMDPNFHELVALGRMNQINTSNFWPVYWFINGRTGPDTMDMANVPWLPSQPYNCMPRMHPGDKVLLRIIGGGRDLHPYHTHGNHVRVIAKDGRLLQSPGGTGADLSTMEFTVTAAPGETVDAIFRWTGENLGWDIYGHAPTDPLQPFEDPADHGKPLPVTMPRIENLTLSGMYSGSPFLGSTTPLPPGEGGFNPSFGFMYMWHSHNENEIVNNNIFPGGMMTMAIVEHPSIPISE